jgi:protein O-mannosyl-transferase
VKANNRPVWQRDQSCQSAAWRNNLAKLKQNWKAAWLGGLFVALMLLVYLPAERGGYVWDDREYVTENLMLRSPGGLAQIWTNLTATTQYYPLVYTSFWLEYQLWGLNPLGYHVVNVLLHTLAAILLWHVLARLQVPGAWLAAGIFALHPVMVESVAWVTERKNVLSAVFYFAAALAYLRCPQSVTGDQPSPRFGTAGRCQVTRTDSILSRVTGHGSRLYCLALFLFVCALLSKTNTCSLPAALLLVFWWKRGRITGGDVWPLLPFFGVGVGLGLVTSWVERIHVGAQGPEWTLSFAERCLIAGRAVWFYAGKLFWPANLTFVYPRWQINPGVWWEWMFPVAALVLVVVLWSLRQRIGRGPLTAVLFFGGTLFPALGFTNVYFMRYSFVADHFQYLAGVGLIVLVVAGLAKFLRPIPLAAAVLPLGLAVLTWKQAHSYADEETLWRDTLAKNPGCWMAHNNLGNAFLLEGQTDMAIYQFQEALRLKPDYAEAHNNLGGILYKQGRMDEAISRYREAIRLKPDYPDACYNLGNALYKKGQIDEAINQYRQAIRLKPDYAKAHYNLGTALGRKGQIDEAIIQFQEAIRLKPDFAEAQNNLAHALEMKNAPAGH